MEAFMDNVIKLLLEFERESLHLEERISSIYREYGGEIDGIND